MVLLSLMLTIEVAQDMEGSTGFLSMESMFGNFLTSQMVPYLKLMNESHHLKGGFFGGVFSSRFKAMIEGLQSEMGLRKLGNRLGKDLFGRLYTRMGFLCRRFINQNIFNHTIHSFFKDPVLDLCSFEVVGFFCFP